MTEQAKTPQQQLDAQIGVLGSLLLDADTWAGAVFLKTREDQYTGEYRAVFRAAQQLHREGKPIDPVTVQAKLGAEYTPMLLQLMDLTPTAANCGAYIDLLVEQAQVVRLQTLGLALAGCHSAQEAAEYLEEANRAMVQQSAIRVVSAQEGHVEFLVRQDQKAEYIPWGFPKLSQTVLTSLGDMVVLGGRPSAGKTALSLQMAWEQARDRKVGYFSFETNPDEVYDRLHAMASGLDSTKIRMHNLRPDDMDKVIGLGREFTQRKLDVIHASGMTVEDVRSVTVARGYQVIYVDYLQIIPTGRDMDRRDRFGIVSQISMDLHRLAVSLGVLVVALSQLSRGDKAAKNKTPDLSDLRESGQIEQDADAVLMLWKDEKADDLCPPRNLKIAKNKKGFAGGYMALDFDGSTQTFTEQSGEKDVARKLAAAGKAARLWNRQRDLDGLPGKSDDLPF